jgi:uncharacterized protein YcbK (DUF882 family)
MPVDGAAVEAERGRTGASRLGRRTVLSAAASLVFLAGFDRAARALPSGERSLLLYNPHTDERFSDVFWCDGDYVPDSLTQINWLMRDFHRDVVAPIDVDLLQLLHRISQRIEARRPFRILSGYRTPATNLLLRQEGWAPAAHSEHLVGKAADICVDRVSLRHLRRAAVSLKAGGVGIYPRDHFIHVDVGPVRVWG